MMFGILWKWKKWWEDFYLSFCNIIVVWEDVCWEFRKVVGISNLRFSVIIWFWMSDKRGDIIMVILVFSVVGSCKIKK